MTRVALLDVNVLVALFDPDHVHHDAAHEWFASARATGWATCAITENGLVRILSNVAYTDAHERPSQIVTRLGTFCDSGQHVFWTEKVSIRNGRLFRADQTVSYRQITDVYLLGLAVHKGGRLATFDRTIPLVAVAGASAEDLVVIPA